MSIRAGRTAMAVNQNGNFHWDAFFDSVKYKFLPRGMVLLILTGTRHAA